MLAKEVLRSALNAGRGSNFEMGRHLRVDRGQNFSRSGMQRQLFLLHLSDAAVGFSVTLSGIQFNQMVVLHKKILRNPDLPFPLLQLTLL